MTTGVKDQLRDQKIYKQRATRSDTTCMFLEPLKHNQINLVNQPSDYLVQIPDLGYHNQAIISCKAMEI